MVYVGQDENGQNWWVRDDGSYTNQPPAADPWSAWDLKSYDPYGFGSTGATWGDPNLGLNLAKQLGLDPSQSWNLYQQGMQNRTGLDAFAGATDLGNPALANAWGTYNMLAQTGNLTPERLAMLQQYAGSGDAFKESVNAQEKENSIANPLKAAGILAAVIGGAAALNGGLGLGVAETGNAAQGFQLGGSQLGQFGGTAGSAGLQLTPSAAAAFDAGTGLASLGSGSMGFFDDILAYGSDFADDAAGVSNVTNPGDGWGFNINQPSGQGFNINAPTGTGFPAPTEGFWSGLTDVPGLTSGVSGFWGGLPATGSNWWNSLGSILGGAKNLGGLLGGNSILGGDLGDLLGTGVEAAPFLAALNYASNQNPFDTSRLESLYNQYSPQANTFEYDLNTGMGRNRLTSNLSRRGVLGSSFGNMDLSSYDTLRELGRGALVNQGVSTSAGLAGGILDAEVKNRMLKNDLYGRALLGLGGALGGRVGVNT